MDRETRKKAEQSATRALFLALEDAGCEPLGLVVVLLHGKVLTQHESGAALALEAAVELTAASVEGFPIGQVGEAVKGCAPKVLRALRKYQVSPGTVVM